MPKRVPQFAHRAFSKLDKVRIGGEAREQAALRADRIASCCGVLREVAALDQRMQVAMDRTFGDVESVHKLRDAQLFIRKGDRLQHVDRELDRTHSRAGTIFSHSHVFSHLVFAYTK